MKKFSSESIIALKNALVHIYWKREDIKSFIYHTIENNQIVGTIDFGNLTKEESVSNLIDRMIQRLDIYYDDILKIFDAVLHFKNFDHLRQWEDPETKIKKAKDAVEIVRKHTEGFFKLNEEKAREEQRKKAFELMQKDKESHRAKMQKIKDDFLSIAAIKEPQKRGYSFEQFLNDLFEFYGLDPRRGFKISGEQIDGAFTFDNSDYLVEAKWQNEMVNSGDLFNFGGKIAGKHKLACGLYISFNGFSADAASATSPVIKAIILMDGSDLMAILDERIELPDLLYRKRRHSAETGNIFFKVQDILQN